MSQESGRQLVDREIDAQDGIQHDQSNATIYPDDEQMKSKFQGNKTKLQFRPLHKKNYSLNNRVEKSQQKNDKGIQQVQSAQKGHSKKSSHHFTDAHSSIKKYINQTKKKLLDEGFEQVTNRNCFSNRKTRNLQQKENFTNDKRTFLRQVNIGNSNDQYSEINGNSYSYGLKDSRDQDIDNNTRVLFTNELITNTSQNEIKQRNKMENQSQKKKMFLQALHGIKNQLNEYNEVMEKDRNVENSNSKSQSRQKQNLRQKSVNIKRRNFNNLLTQNYTNPKSSNHEKCLLRNSSRKSQKSYLRKDLEQTTDYIMKDIASPIHSDQAKKILMQREKARKILDTRHQKENFSLRKGLTCNNPAQKIKDNLMLNSSTRNVIFNEFDYFKQWNLSFDQQ